MSQEVTPNLNAAPDVVESDAVESDVVESDAVKSDALEPSMRPDIVQWLAEIKSLQQQVTIAHQERDEAYVSAASWRSLYETEAKQRRLDTHLSRKTLEHLKTELQELREPSGELGRDRASLQSEIGSLSSLEDLKERLVDALQECDRLARSLRAEQIAHADTRKSLTTALGDAIDQLNEERAVK
ncbi:MAG: hypothetical protein KME15_19225 [Drouetiella hepatica Uher 2000/2452]|jgi:septal ring factor EnvC (AmiA/AmiB activator)|uniref:Uncharacterized protein n=1 Tax=Drouetiella hepatica Uher 2000/2452 TaxID=904376 RepID=A0A951QDI1_9CYAN|nr:hypothetical protein [Drouetiella hepatica Uher 2000/2452]